MTALALSDGWLRVKTRERVPVAKITSIRVWKDGYVFAVAVLVDGYGPCVVEGFETDDENAAQNEADRLAEMLWGRPR